MISSAAHPRWPQWPPSWIWFSSIRGQTRGWLEEGSFRWSAPPLIQDGRHLPYIPTYIFPLGGICHALHSSPCFNGVGPLWNQPCCIMHKVDLDRHIIAGARLACWPCIQLMEQLGSRISPPGVESFGIWPPFFTDRICGLTAALLTSQCGLLYDHIPWWWDLGTKYQMDELEDRKAEIGRGGG
jgi:hypothetical protein